MTFRRGRAGPPVPPNVTAVKAEKPVRFRYHGQTCNIAGYMLRMSWEPQSGDLGEGCLVLKSWLPDKALYEKAC
jgi:hypothetical protein